MRESPNPACYGLVFASVLFVGCGSLVGSDEPFNESRKQGSGECKAREPLLGLARGAVLPRAPVAVRCILPPEPDRLSPVLLDGVPVGRLPRGSRHQLAHLGRHHGGWQGAAEGGRASLEELRWNGAHLGWRLALCVGQNMSGTDCRGLCRTAL